MNFPHQTPGVTISVLSDLKKNSIRASDIAAQYWCERQMEYNYRYGKKITAEMRQGKVTHEELENEVNVPIILQPRNYADALYRDLYRSYMAAIALKESRRGREISIYGSLNGYKIVGKIDELYIAKDGSVAILEDKTKQNDNLPSEATSLVHRVQIMLYKKLIDDIVDGSYTITNFSKAYGVEGLVLSNEFKRQLDELKIRPEQQNVGQMARMFFETIAAMGTISSSLHIRYMNQFTGKEIKAHRFDYRKEEMDNIIKYVLKYWNGERESMPVPESERWKCNWCIFFGKECKVWYKQKGL
jgi:exonuclease V